MGERDVSVNEGEWFVRNQQHVFRLQHDGSVFGIEVGTGFRGNVQRGTRWHAELCVSAHPLQGGAVEFKGCGERKPVHAEQGNPLRRGRVHFRAHVFEGVGAGNVLQHRRKEEQQPPPPQPDAPAGESGGGNRFGFRHARTFSK